MKLKYTLTTALTVAAAFSTQAQIFSNGDFESPSPVTPITGSLFASGETFGGWTVSGGTAQQVDVTTGVGIAESGNQFVNLPNDYAESIAIISQTVTGLSVGMQYQVSWWSSVWTDPGSIGSSYGLVSIGSATSNISYNETTPRLRPGINTPWIKGEVGFVATSTSLVLSIEGGRPGAGVGSFIAFDDVQITAVPEPKHYAALAGLGLLAFGAWHRRTIRTTRR